MIARRLELLLLLFIVVHGKVVTHSGPRSHTTVVHTNSRCGSGHKQYTDCSVLTVAWPQTVHVPPLLHAVASCALLAQLVLLYMKGEI